MQPLRREAFVHDLSRCLIAIVRTELASEPWQSSMLDKSHVWPCKGWWTVPASIWCSSHVWRS